MQRWLPMRYFDKMALDAVSGLESKQDVLVGMALGALAAAVILAVFYAVAPVIPMWWLPILWVCVLVCMSALVGRGMLLKHRGAMEGVTDGEA